MNLYNRRDWNGVIRSTDREMREGIAQVNTFLDRAEAFRNLGQRGKAENALQQAETHDTLGAYDERIRSAREQLDKP